MRTTQEGDKGIGDLKSLTYVRPGVSMAPRSVVNRSRHRKIACLIVMVLLIACAQYVALEIIYASQPAQVQNRSAAFA